MTSISSSDVSTGTREQWATRLVFLFTGLSVAAWAPLVPFAAARLELDDAALGLLLLCLGAGSMVAMPITGRLTARYGCRVVLVAGVLTFALTLPILAIAPNVVAMALALLVFGGSIGTVDVAMNIQAVIVERDSGRTMMSGFHGLYSLGGIVGAGLVGLVLMLGLTSFSAVLCVTALIVALLGAAYNGLLPFGEVGGATNKQVFALPKGIVAFVGALCFVMFLAEGAMLDWGALYLVSARGVDLATAGYGYVLFSLAMTIGRLTGDRIVTRFGGIGTVTVGGVLAALGFGLLLGVPDRTVAFAGFLLIGFGASNVVPVLFTLTGRQTRMPASAAIAAVTTMGYAGVLVGPALIGFVAHLVSLDTALAIVALAVLGVGLSGRLAFR